MNFTSRPAGIYRQPYIEMSLWNVGTGKSWANEAEENSRKRRAARGRSHSRRSRSRSRSRSRRSRSHSRSKEPEEGATKGTGVHMMIYTRKPIRVGPGPPVRGMWLKAFDPEGDYNGPYSNVANLLDHPRYRSNMKNIAKNRARHTRRR